MTSSDATLILNLQQRQIIAADEVATLSPLKGGLVNQVWKLVQGDNCFIIKQYLSSIQNPLFPNLPCHEMEALKQLSPYNLAPNFIDHFLNNQGLHIVVYEYVEGLPWKDEITALGTTLRTLHRLKVQGRFRSLPIGDKAIRHQTYQILEKLKTLEPTQYQVLISLEPQYQANYQALPTAFIHADCCPGNIISTSKGLKLIDWQCPGYGDPIEDIACFTSVAMQQIYGHSLLTKSQIDQLLCAYDHAEITEKFYQISPLYHWRLAAYCAYRAQSLKRNNPHLANRYDEACRLQIISIQD